MESTTAGSIFFDGQDISQLKGQDLKKYRRLLQIVIQDPTSSLNPRMQVAEIVGEPIIAQERVPRNIVKDRVAEVLAAVGLDKDAASRYPHEFSGGQRQRISIARVLAPKPECIILDEPVSALDVSIRAQILNLLKKIQSEYGLTFLIVAHDLAVVRHMSDRIGVMYLGKLVEISNTEDLYNHPLHPYTQALLSAALPTHPDAHRHEIILEGEVPSPLNPPTGCHFHTRCRHAKPECSEVEPRLAEVESGHQVACFLFREER
jgi:oligopeptide/dipeptide ABC transporter ATP-binding protein